MKGIPVVRPAGRTILWLVLAIVLAATLLLGYSRMSRSGAPATAAPPEQPVSDYVAIASGRVDIEGGIIPVAARRPGTIRAVFVQEGDQVTAGQILAQQEDTDARLAAERARAEVRQVESRIAAARIALAAARREYARIEPLVRDRFVSAQRLDVAQDQIDSAEADIVAQQAALASAHAELRQARYDLELTAIRAPVNGLVVRRYANPGVGASTLNVSTMFDIQPDAPLVVRAEVDEATLPHISVGQPVEIGPESGNGKSYPGQVLRRGVMFGGRTLQGDQSDRYDERVVSVMVSAGRAPLLVGQRVMVRFLAPCPAAAPGATAAGGGTPPPGRRCRER